MNLVIRPWRGAALVAADALVLVQVRPSLQTLRCVAAHPAGWAQLHGPNATAVLLADALLWVAACWIGLGVTCSGLGMIPGAIGRRATTVATAVLPRSLQRLIVTTAGLSLLATASAIPATAAPPTRPAVTAAAPAPMPATPGSGAAQRPALTTPGWPRDRPQNTTPTWPTGMASAPQPTGPRPLAAPSCAEPVRVAPGDSLWLITAQRLTSRDSSAAADQIARAWPAWWHRNRAAIGDDPGLLQPGTTLCSPQEGTS